MKKLTVSTLFCISICAAQVAGAQGRPDRYRPAYGPTLSPYLELFRRPTGVFDNYNTFVRPQLELRSTLRAQDRQIRTLERDVQQAATASRVRESGVAPTGTGSVYMNFSHFYPAAAGTSARRR